MELDPKFADKTDHELFLEYKALPTPEMKQELVLRYMHIVRNVAVHMRGVYNDFAQIDDIVNEGAIVIMNAIDKFDVTKNIKFESYISKRIRGLVIDIVRKYDWVSRSVRKGNKDINEAMNFLYTNLGRMPTDQEIANHLNMPLAKYEEMLSKINLMSVVSFESMLEDSYEGKVNSQIVNPDLETLPEYHLDTMERESELKEAIGTLRENEQLVVSLKYNEELSMREIAQVLGVSEPRIFQIHANAMKKLRARLGSPE
ncbi:MAG: FliA/WhiG family RNA polymerase sigma factor [Bacillota bacterium]